jgi:hypothetical protein
MAAVPAFEMPIGLLIMVACATSNSICVLSKGPGVIRVALDGVVEVLNGAIVLVLGREGANRWGRGTAAVGRLPRRRTPQCDHK